MKGTIFKNIIIFLFFSLNWLGCKNDKEIFVEDPCKETKESLIGKWKLTTTNAVADVLLIEDYSSNNIIYYFQNYDSLEITADIVSFNGPKPGRYFYDIAPSEYEGICSISLDFYFEHETPTMCTIKGDSLVINDSALDGPVFYFVKVQ